MRVAVTGASGLLGYGIARGLAARGYEVLALGRGLVALDGIGHRTFELGGPPPDLSDCDALVHAAFSHVAGKYRGGEGDDPEGFVSRNRDGTARLFEAARGLSRVVFLSSRAVYGAYPAGTRLGEDLVPRPDTLYGEVKLAGEGALANLLGERGVSLRATGVFGAAPPGRLHKWHDLFAAFRSGARVAPRIGTELSLPDLAQAVHLALSAPETWPGVVNLSDFVLDRRDLLLAYAMLTGTQGALPESSDRAKVSEMQTARARSLGWRPGGQACLAARLAEMIAE